MRGRGVVAEALCCEDVGEAVFRGADVLLLLLTIFLDSASPFFQSRDVEVACILRSLFRGFAVHVIHLMCACDKWSFVRRTIVKCC
jgi:hypothetical protein